MMNAVERGVVLARAAYLGETDMANIPLSEPGSDLPPTGEQNLTGITLEQVERAAILQTLSAVGGNKSEAARRLGITRKTLHKKLKAYSNNTN
jgi:two-component system response regulator HydG